MTKNSSIHFDQIVEELLDVSKPFSAVHLHRFSDIHPADLAALKTAWEQIDTNRRAALMEDLEDLLDADTLVSFDDLSLLAIEDADPRVRSAAIRLMWETNNTSFWRRLLRLLKDDPEEAVRGAAASGLGVYIYEGELEEIPEAQFKTIEKALLDTLRGSDTPYVRQKSLEALGFSSNPELHALIQKAFSDKDIKWRVSALFAMGRSADERWKDAVTKSLHDPDAEIRFEAVRAAGELSLKNTRQILMEMLVKADNREDADMRQAVVWSLSQIGGERVRQVLAALLDQAEDEEEEEFIAEAIENLSLTEGVDTVMGMMDLNDIDEDGDAPATSMFGDETEDEIERLLIGGRKYREGTIMDPDEDEFDEDEFLDEDDVEDYAEDEEE